MKILYLLLNINIIEAKNKISEIKNVLIEYNMKHAKNIKLYEFEFTICVNVFYKICIGKKWSCFVIII